MQKYPLSFAKYLEDRYTALYCYQDLKTIMNVKILVDSTVDIPEELTQKLDTVVLIYTLFGAESYRDGRYRP